MDVTGSGLPPMIGTGVNGTNSLVVVVVVIVVVVVLLLIIELLKVSEKECTF
jgi:hypothetical protein